MAKAKSKKASTKKKEEVKDEFGDLGVGKKTYKIKKEYLLQLKLNHAEMRELKAQTLANESEMKALDSQRTVLGVRRNELRMKEQMLKKKNDEFLNLVEKETGINLREKAIDLDSFEVRDLD